jgi:hypothetical protein
MMLCSTRPVSPVGTTPFSQWLGLAGSTAGSSEGQLGQAAWPQCKGFTGSCIQSLLPYARSASSATGWPIPLILAQWDVEHGGIFPDFDGYNFGNVRLTPFCSTLSSDFCNDTSPIDGLRDYEYVARLAPYNGVASAAQTGGVNAAALALGKSPWDAGHYVSGGVDGGSLLAALAAQNLYQYF